MTMKGPDKYLIFTNRADWRAWLEKHHAHEREVWLLHYKKKAARQSLSYEEAVDEALCFGWIDDLLRSIDAEKFVLRYSPRKRRSIWAENNKRRVEKLIREGRMTTAVRLLAVSGLLSLAGSIGLIALLLSNPMNLSARAGPLLLTAIVIFFIISIVAGGALHRMLTKGK